MPKKKKEEMCELCGDCIAHFHCEGCGVHICSDCMEHDYCSACAVEFEEGDEESF